MTTEGNNANCKRVDASAPRMQRRYNLAHFILASVIVLVLTPLMVVVGAQARIAFTSDRDRNNEIYLMDDDGKNQRNLTNHPDRDLAPSWSPDGTRIAFMLGEGWDPSPGPRLVCF